MPKCRKCGKEIAFITMRKTGKHMPVETKVIYGEPNKFGKYTIITRAGEYVRVNEARQGEPGAIPGHLPHWVRCPGAQEVKREVKREEVQAVAAYEANEKAVTPKTKQISMFGG